jgi:uncharacterized delta-60 repeat protein
VKITGIVNKALLFLTALVLGNIAFAQPEGSEDPAWSVADSRAVLAGAAWDEFVALPDGKVLLANASRVVRLTANGQPDPSFGNNGVVAYVSPAEVSTWTPNQVLVDPIGRIYIAGSYRYELPIRERHDRGFAVVRLHADGLTDSSYGNAGTVKLLLSDGGLRSTRATQVFLNEGPGQLDDAALQPDGKLLLLSTGLNAGDPDFDSLTLVLRLNENGQLDTTFGDSGAALLPLDGRGVARTLEVKSTGAILVTGSEGFTYGQQGQILDGFSAFMFKLVADGTLDENFGVDGKFVLEHPAYSYEPIGTTLQQDGKVVVTGARCTNGPTRCESLVFRVTAAGTLDRTLGGMGISVQDFASASARGRHVAIDSAGNILVAGETFTAQSNGTYDPGYKPFLLRLSSSGLLDESFVRANLANYEGWANDLEMTDSGALLLIVERNGANQFFYTTIRRFITAPPPSTDGVSSQQRPSFSSFRVDALDATGAFVESGPLANRLGLYGYIYPQNADMHANAHIFVAVATARGWYMRDGSGNFVRWSTRLAELTPAFTDVTLSATTYVPVYAGRLPFAGDYSLYLGYRRTNDTDVIYMDEAALLRITP